MSNWSSPQQQYALAVYKLIKARERKALKERGANPSFGPASDWSLIPRSGAKWTFAEFGALMISVNRLRETAGNKKLNVDDLVHVAWLHGRSANAIREKLIAERSFYSNFEINP